MTRKRVTIRDIATELRLSVGTVSNALNGNTSEVSLATIGRVEAAAERLGYTSNGAARALRTGRQNAISLHVPNLVRALSFYMDFTLGVSEVAADAGLDLVLVTSSAPSRAGIHVDGAVVVDWLPGQREPSRLVELGTPVVSAGDVPDDVAAPQLIVRINYAKLAELMTDAAAAQGATRIAMIAPDAEFATDWTASCMRGVASACVRHGIEPVIWRMPVTADAARVLATAERLVAEHAPDAVLFGPQRFAGIVASALGWGRPGSAVPFLASCAGDPVTELSTDVITAIDTSPRAFGARCARELVALIGAGERADQAAPVRLAQPASIHWATHWHPFASGSTRGSRAN